LGVTDANFGTFRLKLLGILDLQGPDGTSLDSALRRSKRIALLAYLAAARPRGYHRRDKLAALFWPELPEDRARAALRTTLSRLRDDCGGEIVRGRGADELAVDTDHLTCDVVAFDDAISAGRYEEAAALYGGALLDGVHIEGTGEEFESWIERERSRLLAAALRATAGMAAAAEARGDRAGAIAAAQRAVELAPTDELVAQRLIELLLASGDRGSAMREYDELARRLRRDFDLEPSAETAALVQSLRSNGNAGGSAPRPAESERRPASVAPAQMPATVRSSSRARWYATVAAAVLVAAFFFLRSRPAPVTAAPATATTQWHRLAADGDERPAPRVHNVTLLDSTSDALIMLGGIVSRGESVDQSPILNDLWRLNGLQISGAHRWTRLIPERGPAPLPRWQAFGAYDAAHDRAIIQGGALGHSSPCANDSWILDHASGVGGAPRWREVKIRGPLPPLRAQAQGFYEPRSNAIVTFGGNDCFSTYSAELWRLAFDDTTLSRGQWTRLTPDSTAGAPARRNGDGVAYDSAARRLWVHGGNLGGREISDLWRLDHADGSDGAPSWHPVRCAGTSPALGNHVALYDSAKGTLILYTGMEPSGAGRNDIWYAKGLADGGSHCEWLHAPATGDAPLPRGSARGVLTRDGGIVLLGGAVEGFGMMDLWRER
jgi:serine/threonine-protein kinase